VQEVEWGESARSPSVGEGVRVRCGVAWSLRLRCVGVGWLGGRVGRGGSVEEVTHLQNWHDLLSVLLCAAVVVPVVVEFVAGVVAVGSFSLSGGIFGGILDGGEEERRGEDYHHHHHQPSPPPPLNPVMHLVREREGGEGVERVCCSSSFFFFFPSLVPSGRDLAGRMGGTG